MSRLAHGCAGGADWIPFLDNRMSVSLFVRRVLATSVPPLRRGNEPRSPIGRAHIVISDETLPPLKPITSRVTFMPTKDCFSALSRLLRRGREATRRGRRRQGRRFPMFENQVRWVGPSDEYPEGANPTPTFTAAQLQCEPHFQDWGTIELLHVYGAEILPSSVYDDQTIGFNAFSS